MARLAEENFESAQMPSTGLGQKIVHFLSHEAGPFAQFVKYGAIGVMATIIQTVLFYVLASTCLKCLTPTDWAVRFLHLPSVAISDALRSTYAALATACGFICANLFCWMMNRLFVFKPGKFKWYVELGLFFAASTTATVLALAVMKFLIQYYGLMTTAAVFVEIVVSFFVNFFLRKFFIFKG